MIKPAFCFLIYDRIHNEDRWLHFFKCIDPSHYTIHIHAKTSQPFLKHDFFKSAIISDPISTNYGDWTIIKAMNKLAKSSLDDPHVSHILYLSQSCIPLKSFDHILHFLTQDVSYFNRCPPIQCFPRAERLLEWYPREWIQKHSQWCILSRVHTSHLLKNEEEYIARYETIPSAEEHCYLTELYRSGLQDQLYITPNLAAGATTFTNWQGMNYPWPSDNGLKNYETISIVEWEYLLKSPALFGRKFNRPI